MALRTPDLILGPYRERDTKIVTATVRDNDGVAIPGVDLDSFVYTLYLEKSPYAVINGRDKVDGLALVNGSGLLRLRLTQLDMALVSGKPTENHRLLLEWIWNTSERNSYEIRLVIQDVLKVP